MQTATIFNHETVVLDGESFSDCTFQDCRMVYSGGELPHFDHCRFDDCDWKFEGAAAPWPSSRSSGAWAARARSRP